MIRKIVPSVYFRMGLLLLRNLPLPSAIFGRVKGSRASFGINAASTISLELLMNDKPVINLGFDPPGSKLPHHFRYLRHIEFDHYRPVAESGAVRVAHSAQEMEEMIREAFKNQGKGSEIRKEFLKNMFDGFLDGASSRRIADKLLSPSTL